MTEPSSSAGVLTGVVGWPALQSKSPLIHNHWIREHRLANVYAPYEVPPDRLAAFLDLAPAFGLRGLNVTTPHKQAALRGAATATERAERVGAANTLTWREAEGWSADITDGEGFLANLAQAANWTPAGRTILMIGAGGAAGAVVDALLAGGAAAVTISNRTVQKAERLAESLGGAAVAGPWPATAQAFEQADLVINGTSVGLLGGGAADLAAMVATAEPKAGRLSTDLVYAPLETPFLRHMGGLGDRCVDGLGMLLHQAAPGFARWHGVTPSVSPALRELVLSRSGYLP